MNPEYEQKIIKLVKEGKTDLILEELKSANEAAERRVTSIIIVKSFHFNNVEKFREYLKKYDLNLKVDNFI